MRYWAAWATALTIVVVALWAWPISVRLSDTETVQCESFTHTSVAGGTPLGVAVDDYLPESDDRAERYADLSTSLVYSCGVARQNREVFLMLTAISGAALLIVFHPRFGGRPPRYTPPATQLQQTD